MTSDYSKIERNNKHTTYIVTKEGKVYSFEVYKKMPLKELVTSRSDTLDPMLYADFSSTLRKYSEELQKVNPNELISFEEYLNAQLENENSDELYFQYRPMGLIVVTTGGQ